MSTQALPRWDAAVNDFEWRTDRGAYDEETASTVVMPNGSHVCSFDRPFLAAATREVLKLHGFYDQEVPA